MYNKFELLLSLETFYYNNFIYINCKIEIPKNKIIDNHKFSIYTTKLKKLLQNILKSLLFNKVIK